jgi:hypothetical protein
VVMARAKRPAEEVDIVAVQTQPAEAVALPEADQMVVGGAAVARLPRASW